MDYQHLVQLRRRHPAWRLLAAQNAPLVIGFLYATFIEPNLRSISERELEARLDDYLFHLREQLGEDAFPKDAAAYLNEWADTEHGWLRRFYPVGSDEPHFDLTPAAERALHWLRDLERREFIGAESRLKLIFNLLREIVQGSETDPQARIAELERRRAAIEAEIEAIRRGHLVLLDPTQLRERFLHVVDMARALLADFRQVEQNFRDLDRQVRERIATWEGGKGEVLGEVLDKHDAIAESDQGRSFQAFWDFLMSPEHQQELTTLLEQILELEPVAALKPDPRLRRLHYDWLAAGETTQRTVARLSEQLRRYLDDQTWLENRRIMHILRGIEQHALALRAAPPPEPGMWIDAPAPAVALPMDRPLFRPPRKPRIEQQEVQEGLAEISLEPLFEQIYVDKDLLRARVRRELQRRSRITLGELLRLYPLEKGLAELVAWFTLATVQHLGVVDESLRETVAWRDPDGRLRQATFPAVTFVRDGGHVASTGELFQAINPSEGDGATAGGA
ncbi:MAG: DUF3375 domain-containing protein [Clostridia bacterium]|nr:DUF3375 domain-containing protein [Clostridia bacterium]